MMPVGMSLLGSTELIFYKLMDKIKNIKSIGIRNQKNLETSAAKTYIIFLEEISKALWWTDSFSVEWHNEATSVVVISNCRPILHNNNRQDTNTVNTRCPENNSNLYITLTNSNVSCCNFGKQHH